MKGSYTDITSRISDPIKWWDSAAVPRYEDFKPSMCPDVYAREVCLYEIRCQACRKMFKVEGHSRSGYDLKTFKPLPALLGYSDPPRHDCVGDTMTSESVRILEFWQLDEHHDWVRVPEVEVEWPEPYYGYVE